MIETIGLGAGSYPEPPESKSKLYTFQVAVTGVAFVSVYAESRDEAEEAVYRHEFDGYDDVIVDELDYIEGLVDVED